MQDAITWLRELETVYRQRGYLDLGHRFTDADYELVIGVITGRIPESELALGTRWLRDEALAMNGPIDALARCQVGSLVQWEAKDHMEWDVLLPLLSSISHGAFRLDELSLDRPGDGWEFVDLDLVVNGVRRQARFEYAKYSPTGDLLELINDWISDSGWRFEEIGEHFACVRA